MDVIRRLLWDDAGQDLLEYALLAATVGILSAAALALFPGVVKTLFDGWTSGTQTIWDPCDPGTTTTCH